MTSSRAFCSLGFTFRFESNDADLADLVERCYRDMEPSSEAPHILRAEWRPVIERYHVTLEDPSGAQEICQETVMPVGVLSVLTWEINRRSALSRAEWPVLHAAVTAAGRGAVVLCGESHSGKSTLSAAAAMRGWRHLSDDLAPIEVGTMTVEPFPRPIMLRLGARELLGSLPATPPQHERFLDEESFVPASELGARSGTGPEPLVAVVFLAWGHGPVLEPISAATLLYHMTQHSNTLPNVGARGFHDLRRIAESVRGFRLTLGDVERSLDLLAPVVGAEVGPPVGRRQYTRPP